MYDIELAPRNAKELAKLSDHVLYTMWKSLLSKEGGPGWTADAEKHYTSRSKEERASDVLALMKDTDTNRYIVRDLEVDARESLGYVSKSLEKLMNRMLLAGINDLVIMERKRGYIVEGYRRAVAPPSPLTGVIRALTEARAALPGGTEGTDGLDLQHYSALQVITDKLKEQVEVTDTYIHKLGEEQLLGYSSETLRNMLKEIDRKEKEIAEEQVSDGTADCNCAQTYERLRKVVASRLTLQLS